MAEQSLRVLVTGGGTSEGIDRVRRITNTSTGRLGSLIADAFAGAGARVTYLRGENALLPSAPMESIRTIGSVEDLGRALEEELAEGSFDCVIHAMAVSDYTPRRVTTAQDLAAAIAAALEGEPEPLAGEALTLRIREVIRREGGAGAGKLSSSMEDMILLLEKTPKIIGRIKRAQPGVILVGFKLLVGASEEELAEVGGGLLRRNGCDFVLANDQERIQGDAHPALLLGPEGVVARMSTKGEIADAIVKVVTIQAGRRKG